MAMNGTSLEDALNKAIDDVFDAPESLVGYLKGAALEQVKKAIGLEAPETKKDLESNIADRTEKAIKDYIVKKITKSPQVQKGKEDLKGWVKTLFAKSKPAVTKPAV